MGANVLYLGKLKCWFVLLLQVEKNMVNSKEERIYKQKFVSRKS